jgi:glycine/D-amino acid oxidase-like deaminating enzyme
MQPVPFWMDDFPRPDRLPVVGLPDEAGVVVVGAGVTGLSAARRLARAGADVAVVDAGVIGAGASTISGGMTIYGLKAGVAETMDRYGRDLGLEMWQASLDAVDLVDRIVTTDAIDCDFHRSGAVELGYTDRDRNAFVKESAWMAKELGFDTRLVSGSEMASVVGSERFAAALVDDFSGGLHPAKYTYGLAEAAVRAGASLVEHAAVLGITRDGSSFVVRTALGSIRADEVLVATNGYTGDLVPGLQRRIIPVGSYIVVTEPLSPEVAAEVVPEGRMLWTARRFLNYFRLTPDGRLLMGGRHNLSTDLDLAESARDLRATILDFYPQLAPYEITHSWSGRVGVTFDLQPHITRFDGVWVAAGYSGHGMATGTYLGDEVGGMMSGEVERNPFADIPWAGKWFYRKRPWFLPAAALLYRQMDRMGR